MQSSHEISGFLLPSPSFRPHEIEYSVGRLILRPAITNMPKPLSSRPEKIPLYLCTRDFRSEQRTGIMFLDYLRQSCDVYSKSFYTTYYSALERVGVTKSEESLFQMIAECDEAIGRHNNLGEIKDSFLLLVLSQITGDKVFQFCSDDKVARRHIIRYNLDDELKINCISAFGFFYIGKVKGLFMEPEAREYLQSWMSFNPGNCNITIETNTDRIQPDFPKESASDIFKKIWNDTMHLGADGFLQYR